MDKECPPSPEHSAPSNPIHLPYLNQLNKISHKISKPPIRKPSSSSSSFDHQSILIEDQPSNLHQQPPVYNINKSDFRDVVQKLTGSPAHHETLPAPPPFQPPNKPPSSRLQRIRPPPLEHLSTRPPPLLNDAVSLPLNPSQRPVLQQPFSPLPPLPAVHAAAESPVSAYMRYIHTSAVDSDSKRLSPRWTTFVQPPALNNSPTSCSPLNFQTVPSPLPYGCLPSPYRLFSAVNQLGFQQFPLSPTQSLSSPRH